MTPNNPVPLYYMRDNHTFRRLSDNPTVALAEVMEEFDAGWSHGMLCTKRPGEAGTLHVHGGGPGRKFEFEADAAAWLERQRALAAPPAEPAEPHRDVTYPLGIQLDPAKVAALCGEPAEPSVPADGVTDDVAGLIGALRRQRQIDEDGTEVGVSRQAVDEAIERLAQLAPLLTENERLRADQKQGGIDYCRLMDRHDAHFVRAEAAEREARELRGVFVGFEVAVGRNQLMAPATYLDCVTLSCEFQPGDGELRANAIRTALATPSGAPDSGSFQARVQPWMLDCFGAEVAADRLERNDRFIEEALELLQATGYPRERVASLVEYVYRRPVGEPSQEVGGVMVTLAALCLAHGLDMHSAGETELTRILRPEVVAKIRAKQAAKPKGSALPGAPDSGEAKWLATSEDGTMFAAIAASTEVNPNG